jgi:hypothetical protein
MGRPVRPTTGGHRQALRRGRGHGKGRQRRPHPGRGRPGSQGRRAGDGSRPVRSRQRPTRWPTWRTVRLARATAAAMPTGAGSSTAGRGMVSSVGGRVAANSIGSGATVGGGSTRRWMDWPAWITQSSPGWAWRTCSGSMRGRSPIRALASPRGAVEVQLPVVLQSADLTGQREELLRVGALLHDDPAGTGSEQAGRLAVVAEPLDRLGGDHDLDADVANPLGQLMAESTPEARAENSSRTSRASSPSRVCVRWRSGRSPPAPPAWPHPPRSWTTRWGPSGRPDRRPRTTTTLGRRRLRGRRRSRHSGAGRRGRWLAMASMSFNWSGRPSQRAISSSTSRRRGSSSLPSTGACRGRSTRGGGRPRRPAGRRAR